MQNNENQGKKTKPIYKLFYELVDEASKALDKIDVITVNKCGVKEMYKALKKQKINLAYGSLRIDRDTKGQVFLKEFRPSSKIFQNGYFFPLNAERPLWENLGTALVRLYHKKLRYQDEQNNTKRFRKEPRFCIILQGNLQREYINILLRQGRFSYDTNLNHLTEEPIFGALTVLSQISKEQIVETKLDICQYKVIPIEIAKTIVAVGRFLVNQKGFLVLDQISYSGLWNCLTNREKYYSNPSHT
jgi:hypothetical protein